jgi:hypothetical protein
MNLLPNKALNRTLPLRAAPVSLVVMLQSDHTQ